MLLPLYNRCYLLYNIAVKTSYNNYLLTSNPEFFLFFQNSLRLQDPTDSMIKSGLCLFVLICAYFAPFLCLVVAQARCSVVCYSVWG